MRRTLITDHKADSSMCNGLRRSYDQFAIRHVSRFVSTAMDSNAAETSATDGALASAVLNANATPVVDLTAGATALRPTTGVLN